MQQRPLPWSPLLNFSLFFDAAELGEAGQLQARYAHALATAGGADTKENAVVFIIFQFYSQISTRTIKGLCHEMYVMFGGLPLNQYFLYVRCLMLKTVFSVMSDK
jgi:hypothetical protein